MSTPLNYHSNLGLIIHHQHTATSGAAQFKQWNTIGAASKQVADVFFEDTTTEAIRELAQNTDFRGKVSHTEWEGVDTQGLETGETKKEAQEVIE